MRIAHRLAGETAHHLDFPVADGGFLAQIGAQGGTVAVLHHGGRSENHLVAARRQPEGELLVFQIVEAFVETAVAQQHVAAIGAGVRVDEVDRRLPAQAVVLVLVLQLDEAGHQRALARSVCPFGGDDGQIGQRGADLAEPVGARHAVGVGETDDVSRGRACANVARRRRPAARCGDDRRPGGAGQGGCVVGRTIVDDEDRHRPVVVLLAQRRHTAGDGVGGVVGRDDDGQGRGGHG